MLPLIIVRPEPGASATAARAATLGLNPRTIPLFDIVPQAWHLPDPGHFDALLLTSANAVRHAGPALAALAHLPCHSVGPATTAAAQEAGLSRVVTGDSGAQAVVDAMTARGARAILWLSASARTRIVAPPPARITAIATYSAMAIAEPAGWREAIAGPAVIMLHSVRAAQRTAQLVGPMAKHLTLLAISAAVADAAGPGWRLRAIAERPGDTEMLAMARQLCQLPNI
jgi:uroporphyrinogen-III synthase